MHSSLTPLAEDVSCEPCLRSLEERIQNVIAQWASVKLTI